MQYFKGFIAFIAFIYRDNVFINTLQGCGQVTDWSTENIGHRSFTLSCPSISTGFSDEGAIKACFPIQTENPETGVAGQEV